MEPGHAEVNFVNTMILVFIMAVPTLFPPIIIYFSYYLKLGKHRFIFVCIFYSVLCAAVPIYIGMDHFNISISDTLGIFSIVLLILLFRVLDFWGFGFGGEIRKAWIDLNKKRI